MACGTLSIPNAEALVETKFDQMQDLAREATVMATTALNEIVASAGGGIQSIGVSLGRPQIYVEPGNVAVTYNYPPQPELPDLEVPIGSAPQPSAINIPTLAPVPYQLTAPKKPGSADTVSWGFDDSLEDFSDTYDSPGVITFSAPDAPPEFSGVFDNPSVSAFERPPATAEFNLVAPTVPERSQPVLSATAPGDAPSVELPIYPDAPALTMPGGPQRFNIPLPTLRIPDLSGVDGLLAGLLAGKPSDPNLTVPEDNLLNTFDALRGTLGGELVPALPVEETLTWMLAGGTGIPDSVALALRNRAFAVEDRQAFQAEAEAHGDWLSRGFTLPGGALEFKLAEVRQKNRDKKAELNLGFWLEEAKQEIENLRFAVQQGIAYQGLLWDTKTKLWGVCADLASKNIDVQIQVLNAGLSLYKAKLDAWQTEAGVYRDYINALLQTELSKLEITKSETEIAGLFVDLNRQEVDLYKAGLEGVAAEVSLYRARIDAANGRLQGETLKLEAFAKSIQVYSIAAQAYEAEWRGYAAATQADGARIEAFKAQVQAHGMNVDTYSKRVGAESARVAAEVSVGQFALEKFKTDAQVYSTRVGAYGTSVQAEASRVGAEVEVAKLPLEAYKARAQVYGARAGAFGERARAEASRVGAAVEIAKLPVDIYRAEVQAFGSEVDAYGKQVQAAQTEMTSKVEIERLRMEGFKNSLEGYRAELQKASTQITAGAQAHDAQVRLFGTLVESEKARVAADLQNVDQALRKAQFDTSIELQEAELMQTKTIELSKLALSANQEVARVAAQLAGSAFSAVNTSASISQGYSASRQASCSEVYNYEG